MFLGYFMPRKVAGGNETMKTAGTVVKKLGKWLVAKGYAAEDDADDEYIEELAEDLPATQKVLDLLNEYLLDSAVEEDDQRVEGHFWIHRIDREKIWLEPILPGGPVLGPFELPGQITRQCKVGWDIGCAVVKTPEGWQFADVWTLSP